MMKRNKKIRTRNALFIRLNNLLLEWLRKMIQMIYLNAIQIPSQ